MLVNINLLPKREKRSFVQLLTLMAGCLFFLVMGITLVAQYISLKQEHDFAQRQLETTRKTRQAYEQQMNQVLSSQAPQQLDNAVKWLDNMPVSTVKVLNHLVSLLPQRGFFLSYGYSDEGTISLLVQLDTLDGVADYLHQLTQSEMLADAKLVKVTTHSIDQQNSNTGRAVERQENILPRYEAEFQMKLNREALQKEGKK